MKSTEKNTKDKLVKCATEVVRLHKVSIQSCTQNRPSPKVQYIIALTRLNLTFLPLGLFS